MLTVSVPEFWSIRTGSASGLYSLATSAREMLSSEPLIAAVLSVEVVEARSTELDSDVCPSSPDVP